MGCDGLNGSTANSQMERRGRGKGREPEFVHTRVERLPSRPKSMKKEMRLEVTKNEKSNVHTVDPVFDPCAGIGLFLRGTSGY